MDPSSHPAAAAFVAAHADRLWRLCLRLHGGCREDAEDLFQETLLIAWRSWERFLGKAQRTTWLHAIAVRTWQQRRQRQRPLLPLPEQELVAPEPPFSADTRLDLAAALEQLPDSQRLAFLLVKVEGWTYREASVILKTPQGTLQSRVFEATRTLRQRLQEPAPEDETPCPR